MQYLCIVIITKDEGAGIPKNCEGVIVTEFIINAGVGDCLLAELWAVIWPLNIAWNLNWRAWDCLPSHCIYSIIFHLIYSFKCGIVSLTTPHLYELPHFQCASPTSILKTSSWIQFHIWIQPEKEFFFVNFLLKIVLITFLICCFPWKYII